MMIPLAIVIGINILSGAANTLVASGMNKIHVQPDVVFKHPFVQTMIMMFGEASCIAFFALLYFRSARSNEASPWHRKQLLFAIPACLDWCATTMLYGAMTDLPGSQVQMLRGSLVIFVFVISVFILRNKAYLHHFLGVFLVVVGISCVGMSALLSEETPTGSDPTKNPTRGLILSIAAQIVCALLFTCEEHLFRKLQTPAILAVGLEGSCGVIIGIAVLILTGIMKIEKPVEAGYEIFHNGPLFATCLLLCVSIAAFNCSGSQITKTTSATARSTIDGLRTLLVWFGDMSFGWAKTDYTDFSFWLQPIGFAIVVLGTLIYFNTLAIPALMGEEELVEYREQTRRSQELRGSQRLLRDDELETIRSENSEADPEAVTPFEVEVAVERRKSS